MARKGKKMETFVHHKYKDKVDIYFVKDRGVFTAQYGEQYLENESISSLKKELTDLINRMTVLNWVPVLQVSLSGGMNASGRVKATIDHDFQESDDDYDLNQRSKSHGKLSVHIERYWIAQQGSEWLKCDSWHSYDENLTPEIKHEFGGPIARRLNARSWRIYGLKDMGNFSLPYSENESGMDRSSVHYLPYSEELWNGLEEILHKLGDLSMKINELIGSEAGRQMIASLSVGLLQLGGTSEV